MTQAYPRVRDFFLIGKALKSHGTSGQLRLMVEDRFKSYLLADTFVFFNLNGSRVPFKIVEVSDDAHLVLTLEEITSKDQSDALCGNEIWIPVEEVKPKHQKSPRHLADEWTKYRIQDTASGESYPIIRTEEMPQQLMAVVEHNGKELYIPLHDQLIESIDRGQKVIEMSIPEGLLDL